MPELYAVPVTMLRHALTDEVVADFIDKATGITYQQRGVLVPRNPTEREIIDAIGQECAALEVEASTPLVDVPPPVEVPLPSAVINRSFDASGPTKSAVSRVGQ